MICLKKSQILWELVFVPQKHEHVLQPDQPNRVPPLPVAHSISLEECMSLIITVSQEREDGKKKDKGRKKNLSVHQSKSACLLTK